MNYWVYVQDSDGNQVNFDACQTSNVKSYGNHVYISFHQGSPSAMAHGEEVAILFDSNENAFTRAKEIGVQIASEKDRAAYNNSKSKATKAFERVKGILPNFKLPAFLKRRP